MSKEAMKLAIEAADELEWMLKSGYEQRREGPPRVHRLIGKIKALAQPAQQEPVAWRDLCRRLYIELFHCDQQMMAALDEAGEPVWTQGKTVRDVLADAKAALETPPQPAQQEPVAWGKPTDEMVQAATDEYDEWANENKGTTECIRAMLSKALKASPQAQPAQRTWVGLTHDEYDAICDKHSTMSDFDFLEDIEAKLKEKNT